MFFHRIIKKIFVFSVILGVFLLMLGLYVWITFMYVTRSSLIEDPGLLISHKWKNFSTYKGIPMIVHQTWKDRNVPEVWWAAQKTWRIRKCGKMEITYLFWDDLMLRKFMSDTFPWFIETYDSYPFDIQRVDVARYFLLYCFGGIYSDLDIACRQNAIDKILNSLSASQGIVLMETNPSGISNDLMIAAKHHPFMGYVISGLISAKRNYIIPFFTVMLTTGSIYLTRKDQFYNIQSQILHINNSLYGHKYFVHFKGGSWHGSDAKVLWLLYTNLKNRVSVSLFFKMFFLTFLFAFTLIIVKAVKRKRRYIMG
ncbi:Hypothetical predicted protein [Mytilus galloprovincialis]|uniref:Uncharacterized protein n=2 Tax=Mytilus galloprovincialis TaxID=29158 RepID=A0A8B6GYA9_MYTGA|nr:Hypothetical predicted protein [Mytilus galloprovincialis]